MPDAPFAPAVFKFLRDLDANNNRAWFNANKSRYEDDLKEPALQFITDFAPLLHKISPHFLADARPVGGSLFRIYRDTRFAKDKTPYKINTGIQFRHRVAKDAHAPGFYLHIENGTCFVGAGIWHPDTATARKIRDAIDENPGKWKRAAHGKRFTDRFQLSGDSLKRPPRGFDAEHPFIDDLKRKDFIGVADVDAAFVTSPDLLKNYARICRDGAPLVNFLCDALGVPF